jgi:hypothetical protein
MESPLLPDLHDRVLVDVLLAWAPGELTLRFMSLDVVCSQVRLVHVGTEQPWGKSSHCNSARVTALDDGIELVIEMQSGDAIRVICASFDVRSNEASRS